MGEARDARENLCYMISFDRNLSSIQNPYFVLGTIGDLSWLTYGDICSDDEARGKDKRMWSKKNSRNFRVQGEMRDEIFKI